MKEIQGFVAVKDGAPIHMELGDDIAGGLVIQNPFPVFGDADDAAQAWKNYAMLYVNQDAAQIVPVTITFGEPVQTVELKDEEDEE